MNYLYQPNPSRTTPTEPVALPRSAVEHHRNPTAYIPDAGLIHAVNVALILRQPLIVTGEPGTGKTMLAYSIAAELGLDAPLVFETKSTSQAQDLFYTYDTLGRFTSKELGAGAGLPQDYLTFNALGEAIVRSRLLEHVSDIVPSSFTHTVPRRSVVLIDEVEKAPRDFPNDILNEIERMFFRIPELGNRKVAADPEFDPVVIMTNNSEKSLPDAFLRRCVFFHIDFPTGDRLTEIVLSQLSTEFKGNQDLVKDAVLFIEEIRSDFVDLEKKPGTSEFLSWLNVMIVMGADPALPLSTPEQKALAVSTMSALAKLQADWTKIAAVLETWGNDS